MKTYDPEQDVSRLLLRDELEPKRTKLTTRIVKYIMDGDHEKRVDRVEETCVAIERIITRIPQADAKGGMIITAISLALITHDGVDVFIDILCNRLTTQSDETKDISWNSKDILVRAAHRFVSKFMKAVGDNPERSIQFALGLIEIGQNSMQEIVVARSENAAYKLSKEHQTVINFILNSFCTPPCASIRSKAWTERLIEEAGQSQVASDVLESILRLVVGAKFDLRFDSYEKEIDLEKAQRISGEHVDYWSKGPSKHLLTCAMNFRHIQRLSAWTEKITKKSTIDQQKGNELLAWFEEHQQEIDRITRERLDAITNHPRHGLRPFGFDRVNIKLSVLWNAGFRHIVFHPENHIFPETGVKLGIVQYKPHITSYHGTLTEPQKLIVDDMIFDCESHPPEAIRKILSFVLIDILYRIIAAPSHKRLFNDHDPTYESRVGPALEVSVRPFIRRLPLGQEASQTARAFGEDFFKMQLPAGVTFVRAHYRGGEVSFDNMPTGPLMTYTDEHLRQLT